MTTISLKLPEALVARLEAEARSRQKSESAIFNYLFASLIPGELLPPIASPVTEQ
jgi:hypothetical protein